MVSSKSVESICKPNESKKTIMYITILFCKIHTNKKQNKTKKGYVNTLS